MADVESKITKSVSYQFANLLISGLVGVFFIPFIISSLGKNQYGIFEIAFSLNIINVVLDIGVGSTITNYTKKYFDKGINEFSGFFWTYFWVKLILSMFGFLICLLVAGNVGYIFSNVSSTDIPILRSAILWFGVGVLIKNINTFIDGIINGFVRFDLTSFANIISKIFYIIAFFWWYYQFEKNTIVEFCLITFVLVPGSKLIVQLIQTFIYMPGIYTYPKWINIPHIKETLNYLGGMSFITIFAQIFKHGVQTMLSIFAAPNLVAEFGILKRIISFVEKISSMLIRPIMPAAKDLRKKYSLKGIIFKGTKIHSIVVTGLVLLILVNGDLISTYLVNSQFPNFVKHLYIYAILMLTPSFAVMLMLYYNDGKSKMSVQFNLANTVLSLTLSYLGLQWFGLTGFISGLVTGFTLCGLIQLTRFTSYYSISLVAFMKIYVKRYATILIGLGIYLFTSNLEFNNFVIAMINTIIAGSLFIGVAWFDIDKSIKAQLLNRFI